MVWVIAGKPKPIEGPLLRIGIRLKLFVLSLFLFSIPWLGYQYVWELESYLRIGQEQTLMGTARAVATALHERPKLFNQQASFLSDVKPGTDLYAHQLVDPIQLDGQLHDWSDYRHLAVKYDQQYLLDVSASPYNENDLSFTHMVGIYGNYLYAFFDVTDDTLMMRPRNSLRVDKNDHLYIAFRDKDNVFQRYIVANHDPGWINAYRLTDHLQSTRASSPEPRIQGHWRNNPLSRGQSNNGYQIELRIPLSMLNDNIAFAIVDVDSSDPSEQPLRIGTANPGQEDSLGTLLVPSPEIESIIKGLQYANARIWVLDNHRRVMARSGDIFDATGPNSQLTNAVAGDTSQTSWFNDIEKNWLRPLYYKILTDPPEKFVDTLKDAYSLEGKDIINALKGKPDALWRLSPDNKAVILSATHPIWINNNVMGAVVVEQTTHGIRTLRNKALEKLFNVILAVMISGTVVLFLFASRVSFRIRNLRNQTEAATDAQGRIIQNIPLSKAQDEIGDLSRAFHNVLGKLSQYHHYLENMAARLSHELRTPVAIVKSSMENLAHRQQNAEDQGSQVFIDRAQEGISRLSQILNKMSEASRLENALQTTEKETFNLDQLLQGCTHGYQLAYPSNCFLYQSNLSEQTLLGSADLFVQMLDKIITNAVDFSPNDTPILIELTGKNDKPVLKISNAGPLLPEDMQSQLFDSMVSVRANAANGEPHLGIGLYIAKTIAEFHQGRIAIENRPSQDGVSLDGVIVSITFKT
ncbi:proteobacterial dedicated sortase system histidine kinase [Alteromonas sp. a30]|uniref:proteobacterial dedicated sortase system histidine kinase n=1 Tax=Alteromonas sp. a30 TaxID=2730917 RepID=UPI00227EF701|nr:proteobacterial dedicated sortase system histidine kinase [Alteromonas sp. a30]MCY7295173.1 proteobacterial dedicated sortase system histidine kinase [Alteromonas sp. a30]